MHAGKLGAWMTEKNDEPSEAVAAKVPAKVKRAVERAVRKGLAVSESAYVCDAVTEKVQKDGLL